MAWNSDKVKALAEEMWAHNDRYNYPTKPKKKKANKTKKRPLVALCTSGLFVFKLS